MIPRAAVFEHTERVTLELSNRCNYAYGHKRCPASLATEPIILPAAIVDQVLGTLREYGFAGRIAFYGYSEPLIDPRLSSFLQAARTACPQSDLMVKSNGWYLDQTLLDELADTGLTTCIISAYTDKEMERLSALDGERFRVWKVRRMGGDKWRERLDNYERDPIPPKKDCHAPLIDVRVTCKGHVGLCCVDYAHMHTFGDLRKERLEDILRSGRLQAVYEGLTQMDRQLHLCQRCGVARRPGRI
jgi:hypothetical protein